jgi:2-phosphoglycerate kinase
MLYLISGTSRSGKTMIAKKIKLQTGISYLSLDWLVMGFTNGIPEYGINDKLFPDEIAEKIWKFFKAVCENIIWSGVDYIIEGEAMLPELMDELLKKYPNKIKICFVGYCEVDINQKFKDIKNFSEGDSDWLSNESDEYIINHLENMKNYSKRIKNSAEKLDIKYFDTSQNFTEIIEAAVDSLL